MTDGCVFCRIVEGELPAKVVYEGERVIAFDDLSPQAPVHTLIIPKRHYTSFNDEIDPADAIALVEAIPKVAAAKGVAQSGYRVIVNCGADANQTVMHLHVHVLGGRAMSHGMLRFEE